MSEHDVHQAVKLAMDTYPDLLNNPVAKAGFIYANEKEQAAYVIEKLLIKLKCNNNGNTTQSKASTDRGSKIVVHRRDILGNEDMINEMSKEMNEFNAAIIDAQAKLIDLQEKKIERQKKIIRAYEESEGNLYDMLKEYMPEEEYEAFVSGGDIV